MLMQASRPAGTIDKVQIVARGKILARSCEGPICMCTPALMISLSFLTVFHMLVLRILVAVLMASE